MLLQTGVVVGTLPTTSSVNAVDIYATSKHKTVAVCCSESLHLLEL